MGGRRGVLSAGTWCVDLNKTIPDVARTKTR